MPDGVGVEVILEGLGRVIGAAAFGLRVSDLHSSGDEPRFLTKTPKMVGELIKGVLNRDRDGLRAFAQEHPGITEFRARLTNAGAPQSASSASSSSQLQRTRTESCFIKEQQRQAAKDLKAAASGKASFDVLTEAEGSRTIQRLAAMKSDEFADALMAGKLGDPGETLDQLTRTVFTLSLEHVPAGFGNVSRVVEHVKHAQRRHVWAQFKDGKSQSEVTTTLMQKMNYGSHEAILWLEAIRVGYCGIGVPGATKANPRAAVSELRSARLVVGPHISTTEYTMPVTALAVQLHMAGSCTYRPIFGGEVRDYTADTDLLEFSRKWLDAIHGTTSGLANFHAVVKGALRTVSFEELKYAMFKAEYTFMVAQAKKRLGRDVDPGDFYTVFPVASGAAAETGKHVLSTVLQTLKEEAHALLINKQQLREVADEVTAQIAAQVQERAQGLKRSFGALEAAAEDPAGKQNRIDEPGGDDQEQDADGLDAEAYLEDEESVCWKHLSTGGCSHANCPFLHIDREGMGYKLSPQQENLLKRRVQEVHHVEWDWGKIRRFELDEDIFN